MEGIYSAMYCLVALNCMVSLQNNPRGFRPMRHLFWMIQMLFRYYLNGFIRHTPLS